MSEKKKTVKKTTKKTRKTAAGKSNTEAKTNKTAVKSTVSKSIKAKSTESKTTKAKTTKAKAVKPKTAKEKAPAVKQTKAKPAKTTKAKATEASSAKTSEAKIKAGKEKTVAVETTKAKSTKEQSGKKSAKAKKTVVKTSTSKAPKGKASKSNAVNKKAVKSATDKKTKKQGDKKKATTVKAIKEAHTKNQKVTDSEVSQEEIADENAMSQSLDHADSNIESVPVPKPEKEGDSKRIENLSQQDLAEEAGKDDGIVDDLPDTAPQEPTGDANLDEQYSDEERHLLIKKVVEGALIAAGKPLNIERLQLLFGKRGAPEKEAIRNALADLQGDYSGRGVELKEVASGFRFQVSQEVNQWVSKLWDEKPQRYTRALLETLSIIAYRQPITRGDIEEIRGVAVSSNIIKTLLEREWVRVVGHRDVPGRPALYSTTRQFLDYFNLKNLDELPPLSEIKELGELNKSLDLNEEEPQQGRVLELPDDDLDMAEEIQDSEVLRDTDNNTDELPADSIIHETTDHEFTDHEVISHEATGHEAINHNSSSSDNELSEVEAIIDTDTNSHNDQPESSIEENKDANEKQELSAETGDTTSTMEDPQSIE